MFSNNSNYSNNIRCNSLKTWYDCCEWERSKQGSARAREVDDWTGCGRKRQETKKAGEGGREIEKRATEGERKGETSELKCYEMKENEIFFSYPNRNSHCNTRRKMPLTYTLEVTAPTIVRSVTSEKKNQHYNELNLTRHEHFDYRIYIYVFVVFHDGRSKYNERKSTKWMWITTWCDIFAFFISFNVVLWV